MSKCITVVFICLSLCPECSCIFLYCSPLSVLLNITIKARGLASHKTRFNPPFFWGKCPVPSQKNGHCYIIVSFGICYILMLCFCYVVVFLLYLMYFLQFKFVTRICFFLNRFMNLEQRYTTVAFIEEFQMNYLISDVCILG